MPKIPTLSPIELNLLYVAKCNQKTEPERWSQFTIDTPVSNPRPKAEFTEELMRLADLGLIELSPEITIQINESETVQFLYEQFQARLDAEGRLDKIEGPTDAQWVEYCDEVEEESDFKMDRDDPGAIPQAWSVNFRYRSTTGAIAS